MVRAKELAAVLLPTMPVVAVALPLVVVPFSFEERHQAVDAADVVDAAVATEDEGGEDDA